jgi:Ca2+-binding RTX toxin-like protein
VEVAAAELGVAVAGCASGFAAGVLTLTVDSNPLVLSTSAGKMTANGYTCLGTVAAVPNSQLKTTDVTKIVVYGSVGDNKVILDFLPGSFGPKTGGILVNFADNSAVAADLGAGGGADSLMIRAGVAAETYKFGRSPATGTATDVYVEINADKIADIDIKPPLLATPSLSITASMGGGADTVLANATTTDFDKFGTATGLVISPMTQGITAYGGVLDDKFTGGLGNDAFYGGDGNDLFKMAITADGADIYSGDVGNDTVDYSNRLVALNVDLGPLTPSLQGTVDLSSPALYGTGTLNGKTLAFVVNDTTRVETLFTTPASPEAVLAAINTAANTALAPAGVTVYATMSNRNQLVLTNPNGTATSAIQVDGAADVPLAAGLAGEGILGLTPSPTAAAVVTGTIDLTTLAATLDGKRLVVLINGRYVVVTFGTPATAAAMVLAINTAANTALGMPTVPFASLTVTTNHLVLTANSVVIKGGAAIGPLGAAALTALGFTGALGAATVVSIADGDDGIVDTDSGTVGNQSEGDDVRYSTENILSGSGDDLLIGNGVKNSIKGGDGNDTISGGFQTVCAATDGDALLGENGNDTFLSPMFNCKAVLTGGLGDNVADFSGRTQVLTLKNDGAALDGETSELENIGADVLKMIGGFGADLMTGGIGDDTFVGGPGADVMTGAAGIDTVDYTGSPSAVSVTLCFTAAVGGCGSGNDGMTANGGEMDQVYQIEHLIGSPFIDTLSALGVPSTVDVTIEGRDLADTITGGDGNDALQGDDGNDIIHGGLGDDNITGGMGADMLFGDEGDGDICLTDGVEVTVGCELPTSP